jgi:hypothetical protein
MMTIGVVRIASDRGAASRGNFRLSAGAASADGGKAQCPMTTFVLATLTVTAFIWAITEPQTHKT